ncbi:hypothetical protein [Bradyrhizobium lablabi]|uniref:hypothetical protein n=1 Tax=Bradyrhizobium lablabi TaxID=722472 RepID=UPI001BA9A5ED|nr:hypothetical protein [Bradyrhizobium lablabi]
MLIDGVMQAQRSSDKRGLRAPASRRHQSRSRGKGKQPQTRFTHNFLLALLPGRDRLNERSPSAAADLPAQAIPLN